jgi:hypothetical protein
MGFPEKAEEALKIADQLNPRNHIPLKFSRNWKEGKKTKDTLETVHWRTGKGLVRVLFICSISEKGPNSLDDFFLFFIF